MPRIADTQHDRKISELYAQEISAPIISEKLQISLNRIYASLKRQNISRRDLQTQRRIQTESVPLSFEFLEEYNPKQRDLLVAGIMLYSGEGAKGGNTVDLANSNLIILRIFLKFILEVCGVNPARLRFYLYCFDNQDPQKLIRFWSRKLRVPKKNFTKPYVRQASQNNQRIMSHGVLHIRYSDKRLLRKILSLTSQISDSLI
jgi:hypothetical protein